jgi:phage repressor protein C with HTH and peptisase S24 domain
MAKTIPDILKEKRTELAKSQEEMADLLGVSRASYNYYETGRNLPKLQFYKKFKELFDIDLLDIASTNVSKEGHSETPLEKRRKQKNSHKIPMAPLIPIKAQAGYVKAIDQQIYIETLEQFALPPGVKAQGANWAYWEIEGNSMEPVFKNGDIILTSQVPQMDWENLRNFYIYVIVTDERVLFKRIYCKNALEWVLISENEDLYPQQLLSVEYIKQVWVYRKTIKTDAAPTKTFEIKV